MRVLQLTDTLEAGGAERMAVNLANALVGEIGYSALCATRAEGPLLKEIRPDVGYFAMRKRSVLDLAALFRLIRFLYQHKIEVLHAHGTSVFTGVLAKMGKPRLRVIWHDHYGARSAQKKSGYILRFASRFLSSVFAVNPEMADWIRKHLRAGHVHFVPNFTEVRSEGPAITMEGSGKKIAMVANLKEPKNHHRLIEAFSRSGLVEKGWTLHLAGKDFSDRYSDTLKETVGAASVSDSVFFYGVVGNIRDFLSQADLAVLPSLSEGFPVALLEYAQLKLPVVSTRSGYCAEIIGQDRGWAVDPRDTSDMATALAAAASDPVEAARRAEALHRFVEHNYSRQAVVSQIISLYARIPD